MEAAYYDYPSLWIAVRSPFFCDPLLPRFFIPTVRIAFVFERTRFAGVPPHGRYFTPPRRYLEDHLRRPVEHARARGSRGGWGGHSGGRHRR